MSQTRRAMIQLNVAVALFGLAGLLGEVTSASAMMIVMGRTTFGALAFVLLFLTGLLKWQAVPSRQLFKLIFPGIVLAVHWICFFRSIQLSSVAIAILAYSSFPVFVTIFEPILFREPRRWVDALTAGLVLVGVAILVPSFDVKNDTTAGIVWGILAGLTFAVLLLMNRHLALHFSPVQITAGQCSFAALSLLILLPTYYQPLVPRDWLLLVLLGVVFTALAHFLFIQSLTSVRAQLASIVSTLEPVYAGICAWLLLGEVPSARTIGGGILILSAVVIGAFLQPATSQPQTGS